MTCPTFSFTEPLNSCRLPFTSSFVLCVIWSLLSSLRDLSRFSLRSAKKVAFRGVGRRDRPGGVPIRSSPSQEATKNWSAPHDRLESNELRLNNFQGRDCSLLLICWRIGGSPLTNRTTRTLAAARGEPRQKVAHWKFQPAAAFHDGNDRGDLRLRLRASEKETRSSVRSIEV